MGDLIQLRRGLKANLPALQIGEFGFCTDTNQCFIGNGVANILICNSIPTIFTVSANGPYTTISSAITAAVAYQAGTPSNDLPVVVQIANGQYTENLTFHAGVHLVSLGSKRLNPTGTGTQGEVSVVGNHTYAPATGTLGRSQNRINIVGINFVCSTGINVAIGGSDPLEVVFYDCFLFKPSTGDTNFNFQCNNTNATAGNCRVRFNDTLLEHNVTNAIQMDLSQNCLVEFRGKVSGCPGSNTSGNTLNAIAQIAGSAQLTINSPNGMGGNKFTQLFSINSTGALLQVDLGNVNNTLASIPATGTITVANQPSPGNTVTINGWVYTAVTVLSPGFATASEFVIGGTTAATATNLANAITSHSGVTQATASSNVVTVRTALNSNQAISLVPASVANVIGMSTSNGAAFTLSGALLTGGVDGGYIVNFTANGTARLRRSGLFVNDGGCKIANTTIAVQNASGQLQVSACSFSGVPGSPQPANWSDPNISIFEIPNLLKRDNSNRVYVGNTRGFVTIQSAINWLNSSLVTGPGRKTVMIDPGFYQENLVLADNIDIIANTFDYVSNVALPVQIVGKHIWNPTTTGATVQFSNIGFENQTVGGPVFSYGGTGSGPTLLFRNCFFFNNFNGGNSYFVVSNTNGPELTLKDCTANFITDSAPAFLDFSGSQFATLHVDGMLGDSEEQFYNISHSAASKSSTVFLKDGPNLFATVRNLMIQGDHAGEFFVANATTNLTAEFLDVRNYYQSSPASATVTFASQPSPGDTISIGNFVYRAISTVPDPTQVYSFQIGANVNATASNFANLIQNGFQFFPNVSPTVGSQVLNNIVTVISQNLIASVANSISLSTSNATAIHLSAASLSGGFDGGYITKFTGNGNVLLKHSSLYLADAGCKVGSGATGNLTIDTCSYQGNYNYQNNHIDLGINLFVAAKDPKTDGFGNVYVGGARGFQTIQEAIDYANNFVNYVPRKVIHVAPGFYFENLVFADNVDIVADTLDLEGISGAPVNIAGKHTWNPTNGGTSVLVSNIHFENGQIGGPVISYGGPATGPTLLFKNCTFFDNYNDANSMFVCTNTTNPSLTFKDCRVNFNTDSAPAMFDFSSSNGLVLLIDGMIGDVQASTWVIAPLNNPITNTAFIKDGNNLLAIIRDLAANFISNHVFLLTHTGTSLDISGCELSQSTGEGEMFVYGTGNYAGQLVSSAFTIGGIAGIYAHPVLIRDGGTQATGTLTVNILPTVGNRATGTMTLQKQPSNGDNFSVHGQTFTAGSDFFIGVDENATADNIVSLINTTPAGLIVGYVTASAVHGTKSTGSITVASQPSNNDTVSINGQTLTFVTGAPGANQVQIGANVNATASNLNTFINNTLDVLIAGHVVSTVLNSVVSLTSVHENTAANVALATSNAVAITLSGANMTGGTDAVITITSVPAYAAANSFALATNNGSVFLLSGSTLTGGTDGDTITINTQILMFGPVVPGFRSVYQIYTGATTTDTANNIASAIDSEFPSGLSGIQNVVYATVNNNVVTVKGYDNSANGNSYPLAASNGSSIIASGSTLSGGTNSPHPGTGINYGGCSFGFNNYRQSSVFANSYAIDLNTTI